MWGGPCPSPLIQLPILDGRVQPDSAMITCGQSKEGQLAVNTRKDRLRHDTDPQA